MFHPWVFLLVYYWGKTALIFSRNTFQKHDQVWVALKPEVCAHHWITPEGWGVHLPVWARYKGLFTSGSLIKCFPLTSKPISIVTWSLSDIVEAVPAWAISHQLLQEGKSIEIHQTYVKTIIFNVKQRDLMIVYRKEFSLHKLQITLGQEGGSCLEPASLRQVL